MTVDAIALRHRLADPVRLCRALGLIDGAKRQSSGLLVRCPAHNERTPSCSVTVGPDGTVRARCFACDFSADALGLIAQVRGLSPRSQFADVMAAAAELAGGTFEVTATRAAPPPEPRTYPPRAEVLALWEAARSVEADADVWEALRARALDPSAVARLQLARALPVGATVPRWARYRGQPWPELACRLVLPVFDAAGALVSLRAWRIEAGLSPKRLPPAGHIATGLVLANGLAVRMLRRHVCPVTLVVVEGEPDFLAWATSSDAAVIGVLSGAWTPEHAAAVPSGTKVVVRTHRDDAGERYAAHITETLGRRCPVWRIR